MKVIAYALLVPFAAALTSCQLTFNPDGSKSANVDCVELIRTVSAIIAEK